MSVHTGDASSVRRSDRQSVKTERGNAYELEQLTKRVNRLSNRIRKTITSLEDGKVASNTQQIQKDLDQLDNLSVDLTNISIRLQVLTGSEAVLEAVKREEMMITTAKLSVLTIQCVQVDKTDTEYFKSPSGPTPMEQKDSDTMLREGVRYIQPSVQTESSPLPQIEDGLIQKISRSIRKIQSDLSSNSSQPRSVDDLHIRLHKQMLLLDKTLASNDADLIKAETANLDKYLSRLQDASERLLETLEEDDASQERKNMDRTENEVFVLKEKCCSFLVQLNKHERASVSMRPSSTSKSLRLGKSLIRSSEKSTSNSSVSSQEKLHIAGHKTDLDCHEKAVLQTTVIEAKKKYNQQKMKLESSELQIEGAKKTKSDHSHITLQGRPMDKLYSRVIKQMILLEKTLGSNDIDLIKAEITNLDKYLFDLQDASERLLETLQEKDASQEAEKIDKIENEVFRLKDKSCSLLAQLNNERASTSKRSLSSSQSSQSGRSSGKSSSSKSLRSGRSSGISSSHSSASLQEKVKIASLKAEMDFLEKTMAEEIQTEAKKKENQLKSKVSKIKLKIAKSEASKRILDEGLEHEKVIPRSHDSTKQRTHIDLQPKNSEKPINTKLNPAGSCYPSVIEKAEEAHISLALQQAAQEELDHNDLLKNKLPFKGRDPKHQQTNSMEETIDSSSLAGIVRLMKAPTVEIDVFTGEPLEFEYFKSNFNEVVETSVTDQRGRLMRLLKYTSGQAKELIKHCILEESFCYDKAMNLLECEYGNKEVITEAFLKELREWPALKPTDNEGFKKFYWFLLKCKTYKQHGRLSELDSSSLIRSIILKLNSSYQHKWMTYAENIRRSQKRQACFDDVVKFVDFHSACVNNPSFSVDTMKTQMKANTTKHMLTEGTKRNVSEDKDIELCPLCKKTNHDLEECTTYISKDLQQRKQAIRDLKLCFGCFVPITKEHVVKTCPKKRKCETCHRLHPSSLHDSSAKKYNGENNNLIKTSINSNAVNHTTSTGEMVSMCVVPVYVSHESKPDQEILCYALLDMCCTGCLALPSILTSLAPDLLKKAHVTIETANGYTEETDATALNGLQVRGLNDISSTPIKLPTIFSGESIPAGRDEIPTPDHIRQWKYLDNVRKSLPDIMDNIEVSMIIGGNCTKANEPHEVVLSEDEGPFAYRSRLGWCIVGPMGIQNTGNNSVKCRFTRITSKIPFETEDIVSISKSRHYPSPVTTVKDDLISNSLRQMYTLEFNETSPDDQGTSTEDDKFMEVMKKQSFKEGPNHILPLPFRNQQPNLPNNRQLAEARLFSIERKMNRNWRYKTDYIDFIENMIKKGYVKECNTSDMNAIICDIWYLPHHGVMNPAKGKLRVVFDCSASFHNRSLNSELMQGPDLTNGLLGVLLRFREKRIAVMADIESMFSQVRVPEYQQNYQRFLWRPNGDLHNVVKEYKVCVHTFGAISSPSCSNFALRKTAAEGEEKYGTDAANSLCKDFYVDDWLKSNDTVDASITLLTDVQGMCKAGGFNLTKFVSNSPAVISAIPPEHRAPSLANYDLSMSLPIERALGVIWSTENDSLGFRISTHDIPLTRRGMLATVSAIYDPLGLASPFLLKARQIIQEMTYDKKGWDDPVSDMQRVAWNEWRSTLPLLSEIQVKRCFKSDNFGKAVDVTLHGFADANLRGYGTVFYLRQVNESGQIDVSIVMGKSRVAPLNKPLTIPRLELTAADLAAKVGNTITKELEINHIKCHFWSDSMVTLGYINNDVRRFKLFVTNRVKRIRSTTSKEQWRYVASKENPADYASKGLSVKEEVDVRIWFDGPRFLYNPEYTWSQENIQPVAENDPEIKNKIIATSTKVDSSLMLLSFIETHISSWSKMLRLIALILKFLRKCQRNYKHTNVLGNGHNLCVADLQDAEVLLLKLVQKRSFSNELRYYSTNNLPSRASNKTRKREEHLWKLDPFIDNDGLLRVGGRLRKSDLDISMKHPVILPKTSTVVRRIIEEKHMNIMHCGRTSTINKLRSDGYWVISCGSIVRSIIHRCVPCRKLRGRLGQQKMADLPPERSAITPPFTNCGVDIFGPFLVKEVRKERKRFGSLFTCLQSRAIHIEVTNDMSTDSFILCLRRFLARRGPARTMWSDNGRNFVGANNELKKALKQMDNHKIELFLLSQSCDWISWKWNPPYASHMGGVWERQIRSVRSILISLLSKHANILNDESLHTLMCEVEAIVNSRPLTIEPLSDPTIQPLSPNTLLTMKVKPLLPPPGVFQREDMYCRRRWRQVQHLANEFWCRWKKEYLVSLQSRNKWDKPKRNLQPGDIVLMKDGDMPRQKWPIGRVVNVFKDSNDNLVRFVELKLPQSNTLLKRPIHKLVLIMEANDDV